MKFLKKHGISTSALSIEGIEEFEIDVTGQSKEISKILDENSVQWQYSSNRYGCATQLLSATADYWTLLTMLYAIYKFCNSNVAFYIKVKGSSKPIKMIIADYLRYLADKISNEN